MRRPVMFPLAIMLAGTITLAMCANRFFGVPGLIIMSLLGLLITIRTLRL